ncbi:peptidoglycan D,D-transpeptidase FtsI family protein [Velocimicrobium porci]|uniref:Penicillin-binding protein 2 n=1 Tax=Velocimicrobium porci TaxID=2606634 RepID=A0A6L5XYM4_9FIRM|nr:penicillin-binding transpeptidase domain-containing protein [Velocimicrobium porci]MSS63318.1 penicillin-binding protein 2 [Velocimicrobium porci]
MKRLINRKSEKDADIQKKPKKKSTNREILVMTYLFVGIFVFLIGKFVYFIVAESPNIINSTYNKRQDLLAERVVRGKILGSKGEILAETVTDANGTETRNYPYNNIFCHAVGRFTNGKTGIEQLENINLLTSGENPLVAIVKELRGEKNKGDNAVTTFDVALQKTAYEALGNRRGAVVALEPSTGKVLAMVSKPDYNPNTASANWDSLIEDSDKNSALVNRATQGLYPPGSTFKILTALEYMIENKNYQDYQYACNGKDTFGNVVINCYGNKNHGTEDLRKSFAKSCNGSFANIGMNLNLKSYRNLCETFLFNQKLPTDFITNNSSFTLKKSSDKSEVPQTAIGQGNTQITPLHNALITATIANNGVMMKPYLVDRLETYNKDIVKQYEPEEYGKIISETQAKEVQELMHAVVTEGTATSLSGLSYACAGKTGSAEYDSNKSSHGWFVGYAPYDNPKIVVSVIVEDGGTGSESAVPIAKRLFQSYLG